MKTKSRIAAVVPQVRSKVRRLRCAGHPTTWRPVGRSAPGFPETRFSTVAGVGFPPDVIVECTGVGQVIADSIQAIAPGGVVCLTGVGSGGRAVGLTTADVASNVVLRNNVVVGSVNANNRHWYKAGQVLARADRAWLACLVTRRAPFEEFMSALQRRPEDIKVVIQFAQL